MNISLDSHQSIAPETVPPRSENVIKDGKMVKLLESHDILVDKDLLRNAISAAKKSQKVGYTLCYKLLSGMFSIPELANSRGQGIGKRKEGDIRPPLKRETVNTLKDQTATEGAELKAAEAGAAPPSVEAKDVAPPPYYGSLFGELKQTKENSDGQVDFVKTCCGPCCGTCCRILGGYVACTVCLGIFLAIPIAMIAVGK
ncbi:unnamed protein product [Mytilus edulis]|uniref:Uncharacterized protein n=1 Tax=Mytilus edulis TaxID=6550 RepID=A0A8S3QJ70_MYTED|nr:unnamed protein product [Mytilus edulis]